jgi:antitoxin ParD1/3/4
MAKTTSFNLGEHFEKFIAAQISSGRYNNVIEVVRDSLRLMED